MDHPPRVWPSKSQVVVVPPFPEVSPFPNACLGGGVVPFFEDRSDRLREAIRLLERVEVLLEGLAE